MRGFMPINIEFGSVVSWVIIALLGIVAFGIKNILERIEKSIDLLFSKFETVKTVSACDEKHVMEKEWIEGKFESTGKDINGIGAKLEGHIRHGH